MREVNILGSIYTIEITDDNVGHENDGICMFHEKKILVRPCVSLLGEGDSMDHKEHYQKQVLRHELMHAILYESGLSEYAYDETLVEYFAIQFPKICGIIEELEAN